MSIQFLLREVSECFKSERFKSECFRPDKRSLAISLHRRRTIRFTSTIMLASQQKVKKMSNERFLRLAAVNTQRKENSISFAREMKQEKNQVMSGLSRGS